MILLRLADLPRSTWRLARSLPALAQDDGPGGAIVQWGMRPALLDPSDGATLERVALVIAGYDAAIGRPREDLRALERTLEARVGDYRVARALARCVEEEYTFEPPRTALALAPVQLRALVYQRAQERHGGYVPSAERDGFLADLAVDLECTPFDVEVALRADAAARAVLERRGEGTPSPGEVVRLYNAAAVATLLAAAAFVVLRLPFADTGALKDLYRRARALRTGVDLTMAPGSGFVEAALYGPGSRALVRLREASVEYDAVGEGSEDEAGAPALLPAPGGAALAAVVAGMARRHPRLTGWAHLQGPPPDRRLYHYPLDAAALTALAGGRGDPAVEEQTAAPAYDSAVEAGFAAAFLAEQTGGRMGLARGWAMEREPRPVIAGATVFLPDFGFRRGEVEVLCEVVGYYTEEYLARKRRKLADLRGRIALLLVVDEALAPHIAGSGFPTITYRAGREVRVTEVVAALDREFDSFARRRAAGVRAMAALCREQGPPLDEQALCAATGCAGHTELAALWQEVEEAGGALTRRYVAGQGLVPSGAHEAAAALLAEHLAAAGGCLPVEAALDLCRQAGLPEPDDALLGTLGVEVRREGLFGAARACLPGTPGEPEAPAPPRTRRRR